MTAVRSDCESAALTPRQVRALTGQARPRVRLRERPVGSGQALGDDDASTFDEPKPLVEASPEVVPAGVGSLGR
jgi:hypothetical protein